MEYRPFSLRSWQFALNAGKEYLAASIDRTIAEAQRYQITHLEFCDNTMCNSSVYTSLPVAPCRNWVLCGLSFRDFPRLARHDVFHQGAASISRAELESDFIYMRDVFRKVKASGLGVMAWHHLRRELPDELGVSQFQPSI